MLGALAGVVGRAAWLGGKVAFGGAKLAYRASGPAMSAAFAVGTPVAKTAVAGAGRAAGFALRHPQATMIAGVGALGIYGSMQMAAQTSEMGEDEVNRLAMMTGPSTGFTPGYGSMAYDPGRMRFQGSVNGLVQGLHRGRH